MLLNTDYISLTLEMIMLTRDTLITLLVLWLTTQYTLSAMLTYVLVLKDKYMSTRRRKGNPVAIPSDSVLWKAICKEWDTVNQNATWNVGNGKRILF